MFFIIGCRVRLRLFDGVLSTYFGTADLDHRGLWSCTELWEEMESPEFLDVAINMYQQILDQQGVTSN